jgi:hypothetical protein
VLSQEPFVLGGENLFLNSFIQHMYIENYVPVGVNSLKSQQIRSCKPGLVELIY